MFQNFCVQFHESPEQKTRKLSSSPLICNSLLLQALIVDVTSNNQIMYGKIERSNSIQKVQKDWNIGSNFKS